MLGFSARCTRISRPSTLALALVSAAGCITDAEQDPAVGDAGETTASDAAVASGPILPWSVGNSWTYRVTDSDGVSTKVTEIDSESRVDGSGPHADEMAYKVVTLKADGTDQTVSWQAPEGDKVIRFREQSFAKNTDTLTLEEHWDPYKLHVDGSPEHTRAEATWLETYDETKLPVGGAQRTTQERDRWTVDQPDASVTVPAGTFDHCIVFTKAGGNDLKTYWYVRGIGKIKETGGQTEELLSYEVAP